MRFCKLFVPVAAGVLLSSCMKPNLGGVVDAIGREVTVMEPNGGHPKDLKVYKLDGLYYVEVQLTWQHVKERCLYYDSICDGRLGGFSLWDEHDKTAPKETYLLLLQDVDVKDLLQKKVENSTKGAPKLISQAEFDYARAERCVPRPKRYRKYQDESKLVYGRADEYYSSYTCMERRSWLNMTLKPLAWVAHVVDVPLTLAINAPLYTLMLPCMATQEMLVQTGLYEPWEEPVQPLPIIVVNNDDSE